MSRVFRITPKRVKRTNGTVLTPDMGVTATTQIHTSDPFYNGAKEVQEAYMRLYGFDYKRHVAVRTILSLKSLISLIHISDTHGRHRQITGLPDADIIVILVILPCWHRRGNV